MRSEAVSLLYNLPIYNAVVSCRLGNNTAGGVADHTSRRQDGEVKAERKTENWPWAPPVKRSGVGQDLAGKSEEQPLKPEGARRARAFWEPSVLRRGG